MKLLAASTQACVTGHNVSPSSMREKTSGRNTVLHRNMSRAGTGLEGADFKEHHDKDGSSAKTQILPHLK